jgi:hypothetical protein
MDTTDMPLRVKPELETSLAKDPLYRNVTDEQLRQRIVAMPGMTSRRGKREPIFNLDNRAVMIALLRGTEGPKTSEFER